LTREHIGDLRSLLSRWSPYNSKERSTLELGLSRLASSIQRKRGRFWLQDRILDTAIALEVMYELRPPELSYRLQTRAGHLLADTTEERIAISKEVKQFYGLRSSIAHGKKGVDAKESGDAGFALAETTLRELLRRESFPDWERLVMSSTNTPN
ncbi:MAG: HEPN domain-containing protein, partial [Gemmatimonadota bacterium]|nr:HEPN domain-containing protein [Gemmatimonadota bacterium]